MEKFYNPKKKIKRSKKTVWLERLSRYICPVLLGSAICYSIIDVIYPPDALSLTITAFFCLFAIFLFFDKIKKMKEGGIIYTAVFIGITMYCLRLFWAGTYTGISAIDWFYGEEGVSGFHPTYMRATFIGGGFFVASVLYYFTQVRYRTLGVMLCTLFPFVLYAKRGDVMPSMMITVIITLFLAVVVHNRRIDPAKECLKHSRLKLDRAYIMSFAVFISVTGAIAMTVKKPTYRSQLEKSADFFDTLLFQGVGTSGYEGTSSSSSTRRGGFGFNSTPIFYVKDDGSQEIYYLRRQVYSHFDGDIWEANNRRYWQDTPYSQEKPEYSTDDIINDMRELSLTEQDIKVPEIEKLCRRKTLTVYDEDFSSSYLPAPYGVITDEKARAALKYFKYAPTAMTFRIRNFGQEPKPLSDTFEYMDIEPGMQGYADLLSLTGDKYRTMLESHEGEPAAERLLSDYLDAYANYMEQAGISSRLKALSADITKNARGDYEKARLLERYFTVNGYTYSTEYTPSDNSVDYFVFESKTGYCAGYATAMTLMARSVGLPARYVEGFAAFEREEEGGNSIVVRDGHAHAFVEVYVAGAGWLTFDPTVSTYRNGFTGGGNFNTNFLVYLIFMLSRFFIVIIVLFFVIFVVLFDRIKERLMRIGIRFLPVKKRVFALYKNLYRLTNFSTKEDYSAYTVKMLRRYFNESRGISPEKLLDLFEKTAFGGYEPTKEEYKAAYAEYKKCYKFLRKIPKRSYFKKSENFS
ncbi:MAG: transglutaminase domain-containing protein [Firmicutes bacterium]|nr:transglutaminase domain-containing protein [Bacillota bacterium]